MRYSIWNQGLGAWDYYESSRPDDKLNAEKPSHLVSRTLGSTVDQAAWPLPGDARHIGAGPRAIGKVASRGGSSLGADLGDMSILKAGLLVLAGALTMKYVVRKR